MIYKAYTVVFEGVEARSIEVQCALSAGLPGFSIAGHNCKPLISNFNNYRDINSSFSPLGHSYNRFS